MFGSIQVAQQRDLGAVVQHLLVDPPNDVEEWLLGVTAVGVGAVSEMLAGRADWTVGAGPQVIRVLRMSMHRPSVPQTLGRGVLAGLAGTAAMTAFQKLVEMPLTGRSDSYAPAAFAEKVLHVRPESHGGRKRLNYGTHFALGTLWGGAYGVAARAGLRGQRAVAAVFLFVYTGDVLLNTALGLYEPSSWSRRDVAIDVLDKLVQAEATGAVFDHVVGRRYSLSRT